MTPIQKLYLRDTQHFEQCPVDRNDLQRKPNMRQQMLQLVLVEMSPRDMERVLLKGLDRSFHWGR